MKRLLLLLVCVSLAGCAAKTVELHFWGKYYDEAPQEKEQDEETTIEVITHED